MIPLKKQIRLLETEMELNKAVIKLNVDQFKEYVVKPQVLTKVLIGAFAVGLLLAPRAAKVAGKAKAVSSGLRLKKAVETISLVWPLISK